MATAIKYTMRQSKNGQSLRTHVAHSEVETEDTVIEIENSGGTVLEIIENFRTLPNGDPDFDFYDPFDGTDE